MPTKPRATSTEPSTLAIELRGDASATYTKEVRARIDRAFGHWASLITRVVVRSEDINGPRGGVDRKCSIDVNPISLSPVHYDAKATTRDEALAKAVKGMERLLRRLFERRAFTAGRASISVPAGAGLAPAGSLVGRREGRSAQQRALARARPEKTIRNLWVDTAQAGVSATDRKAGQGHSARRNARKQRGDMTVLLEDSLARPSRKSTRRSANRGKPSQGKERAAVARVISPSAPRRRAR